jgi:CDP-diacylglycerol--glycerol-3-phosphate 3-phosphatidyltransferase
MDGIIARRTKRITVTGALLDPVADKLLISAAFISLVELNLAPSWMVTCIVGREFAVTALRMVAIERRIPIAANAWGKAKTGAQVVAVALLILGHQLGQWIVLGALALWVALALTLASMAIYFIRNWGVVVGADR